MARLTEALRRLWSPVEVHEVVGSSRPDVFRTLADPTTYPDWLVGAQRIRHVDPAFPAPSSGFDHSVGPTPSATVDDSTEARRVEAPARLDLLAHVGPLEAEVQFLLDEVDGDGTRVTMRERPVGAVAALTPLLRPLLSARNARSLRQLRRLVGAPPLGTLG